MQVINFVCNTCVAYFSYVDVGLCVDAELWNPFVESGFEGLSTFFHLFRKIKDNSRSFD